MGLGRCVTTELSPRTDFLICEMGKSTIRAGLAAGPSTPCLVSPPGLADDRASCPRVRNGTGRAVYFLIRP